MTKLHRQIHGQEDKSWMWKHKNTPNMEFKESFQRVSGGTTTHVISSMPNTLHCSLICVLVILLLTHVYSKRQRLRSSNSFQLWSTSSWFSMKHNFFQTWCNETDPVARSQHRLMTNFQIHSHVTLCKCYSWSKYSKCSKYQYLIMNHDSHDNILPAKLFPHWAQTVC